MKFGVEPKGILQGSLEWVGHFFSLVYFVSPAIEIVRLYKGKIERKSIPMFLLLSILFNCLFWCIFGFLHDPIWISMMITNGIGLVVNIALMFLYLYLFLDHALKPFIGYGFFVVNLLVEATYLIYELVNRQIITKADDSLGYIAMVFNVIMYASPITNIIKLFQNKSKDFIPIYTNAVGFLACSVFIAYGVLTESKETWISNTASLAVIVIQIGFWVYFYIKNPKSQPIVIIDDVESGDMVKEEEAPQTIEKPESGDMVKDDEAPQTIEKPIESA